MSNAVRQWMNPSRWKFQWRYWRGRTPWDTNVTPPEVTAFLDAHPPGRALDLGCGTGTNAITLALCGWDVVGVDFASKAIRAARRKAAAAGLKIDFHQADVTDLGMLAGPFDYVLDIGCLFTLNPDGRINYAEELVRLTKPQTHYMLYAWLPRPWRGKVRGLAAEEIDSLLGEAFSRERMEVGEDKGHPSAWYWFQRR